MACNTNESNTRAVALSVVDSEAEGIHSHGWARLPTYCEHAKIGKINGNAMPTWQQTSPAAIRVDAVGGFAHPAIDLGLTHFLSLTKKMGIAAMAVTNSYICGVVGYHMKRIAEAGLVALGFVNAPASIAPYGGKRAVVGTNPIACGIPRQDAPPLVIDQSSSVVAKSEVVVHKQNGQPIPLGWAFDKHGQPTTDAEAALDGGTMAPIGKYKGANLALLVELMAVGMTGATLGIHASSFATNEGGSPRTGQFFIGMQPTGLAGPDFYEKIESLFTSIAEQEGARLPGSSRLANRERIVEEGVTIRKVLYERLLAYGAG